MQLPMLNVSGCKVSTQSMLSSESASVQLDKRQAMTETPVVGLTQIRFGHCGLVKTAVLWVCPHFFLSLNGGFYVLWVFGMKTLRGVSFYKTAKMMS